MASMRPKGRLLRAADGTDITAISLELHYSTGPHLRRAPFEKLRENLLSIGLCVVDTAVAGGPWQAARSGRPGAAKYSSEVFIIAT